MPLLNELIQKSAENKPAFVPTMTKEEFKSLKKDEQAVMWDAINQKTEDVLSSAKELYSFLQAQARMPHLSANNILYLQTQHDDVSMLKTFDQWKDVGRSVNKDERSLRVIVGEAYTRKDGKDDIFFTTKPFFDISQTTGRTVPSERTLGSDQTALLTAMIHTAQDKGFGVIADNEVPSEIGGTYQDGEIRVRDDIELEKTIYGLALGSIAAERDRRGFRKSSSVEICSAIVFCEAVGMPIQYDKSIELLLDSVVMDAQSMTETKYKRNLLEYTQKSAKSLYEEVDRTAYQLRTAERQQEAPDQDAPFPPSPEQASGEKTQPAEKKKPSKKQEEPER